MSEPTKPIFAEPGAPILKDPVLQSQAATLARLRRELVAIQAEIDATLAPVQAALQPLLAQQKVIQKLVYGQDQAVRERAIEVHNRLGLTHPAAGVEIIQATTLTYEDEQAIEYCVSNRVLNALSLSRRPFEKFASVMEPPFVRITKAPAARIAQDLDAHYPAGSPEEAVRE